MTPLQPVIKPDVDVGRPETRGAQGEKSGHAGGEGLQEQTTFFNGKLL